MLPLTRSAGAPSPPAPGLLLDPALDPGRMLAAWMATAFAGDLQPRLLRLADGRIVPLPVARWAGPVDAGDESMLTRAKGPVLDVGCGPGRLTAALHVRGTDVLGLELLPTVPVLARRAGAPVVVGDVFEEVPRTGQWRTVLLADGNIGIGGDAARMLRRVRGLLAPGGQVLCELQPDGEAVSSARVRLEGLGATSDWFSWALLDRAGLAAAVTATGLRITETWQREGRPFAALTTA